MARKKKRKKIPQGRPKSKYECRACKFKWEGYRVLPKPEDELQDPIQFITDPEKPIEYIELKGTGMTLCPQCKGEYVHWVNYASFAKWYRKNVGDGGCGGEPR